MNFLIVPFLHRIILRELTQTFLLCVVALLTLILIGRGLQLRDLFLGLELGLSDIALLFGYMMPMFLLIVLPISCMISVFLTFLRMSTDRELIALKAGGVSVYQMLLSPLLFSCICMGLALFVSLHGISWGMNQFRSTLLDIANTRAKVVVQPGVFNQDIFGLTLFARKVDPETGRMQEVVFEDKTQTDGASITILAPSGEIITDEARGEIVFNLQNGRIYRIIGNQFSILAFKDYAVHLNLSEVFKGVELGDIRPKEMDWQALLDMEKTGSAPSKRFQRKVSVEIQKRWALPVACLVLGVFALPLACSFEGVKRQMGVILALLLFLAYYTLFSVGLTTGESGRVPPVIGMWMANALFSVVAVVGIYLTATERIPSITALLHRWRKMGISLGIFRKESDAGEEEE